MIDYFEKFLKPRKAAIAKAVLRIVDRLGISGVTTKKIASEVGFAEGALYRHVKSKEEIFEMILELANQMLSDKFLELREVEGEREQLRSFFFYALDFLEQFPGIYHIIFSDAYYSQEEKLFRSFETLVWDITERVEKIIAAGQERGVLCGIFPASELAMNYLGTVHTSFTLWNVFEKRRRPLREVAEPFFKQFLFLIASEVNS